MLDEIKLATTDEKLSNMMKECFINFLTFVWSTMNTHIKDKFGQTIYSVVKHSSMLKKVKEIHDDWIIQSSVTNPHSTNDHIGCQLIASEEPH